MTDLKPLRSCSEDELALAMLRSADADGPDPSALLKAAAALGVGASALGVATEAAGAVAAGSALGAGRAMLAIGMKFGLGGALAGLAVSMGATWVVHRSSTPVDPSALRASSAVPGGKIRPVASIEPSGPDAPSANAPPGAATAGRAQRTGTALGSPPESPLPAPSPARTGAAAPNPPASTASFDLTGETPPVPQVRSGALSPAKQLREEVLMLDRAREALARAEPRAALVELDRYQQRWPTGVLAAEALVVRVEALVRIGEPRRAASLARGLLEAQPNSHHAAQLRALLAKSRPE